METILAFVVSFCQTLFDVGTEVITFIMTPANAICLIPLVAWIVITGVNLVRGLYRG